jgi:hypothetical protein
MGWTMEWEITIPSWLGYSAEFEMERTWPVSISSPPSYSWKSATNKDDSYSSDVSRSGSEAGFVYAYRSQNLLEKANSLKESKGIIGDTSFMLRSQDWPDSDAVTPDFSSYRTRTWSTVTPDTFGNSIISPIRAHRPKVMKYAQKLSKLFESMVEINPSFSHPENVCFFKATHELDGQNYILKKIRIFVKNDEEIKEHPAYEEISLIKDNELPFEIRYVNSWIELDENSEPVEKNVNATGVYVFLYLQMRYTNDYIKLARDLIISKWTEKVNLDEDTIFVESEDTYNYALDLHKNGKLLEDAITQSFTEIGYDDSHLPITTQQQTWRICFDDALQVPEIS